MSDTNPFNKLTQAAMAIKAKGCEHNLKFHSDPVYRDQCMGSYLVKMRDEEKRIKLRREIEKHRDELICRVYELSGITNKLDELEEELKRVGEVE